MNHVLARSRASILVVCFVAACLLAPARLGAQMPDRSLYWRSFDVTARLDADGLLHVTERQAIVFDGPWNGGERRFNVWTGQSLDLRSITRIDSTGAGHRLGQGDLTEVDTWKMFPGHLVRWRSRKPDDPPFHHQEITYVIDYTLTGVLRQSGSRYLLAHDFAFPDRDAEFRSFSLRFDVDPVWSGLASPVVIRRAVVPPHEGVVVRAELTRTDGSSPNAVLHSMPPVLSGSLTTVFVLGLALLVWLWYRAERAIGRFGPIDAPRDLDEEWLQTNVFDLNPEVVATALRGTPGATSVAAFLARMTQEGKLETRIESSTSRRPVLHLRLLVARDALDTDEKHLVNALFKKRTETDTETIRKTYRNKGFDPAGIIAPSIEKALNGTPGWAETRKPVAWNRSVTFAILAAAALVAAAITGNGNDLTVASQIGFLSLLLGTGALTAASFARRAATSLPLRFSLVGLFLVPLVALAVDDGFDAGPYLLHALTLVATFAWVGAVTRLSLDAMRTDEAPDRIAFRRRLAAARGMLAHELRASQPRLHDSWYPWLLALGLGKNVDRWFRSFAGAAAASTSDWTHTPSAPSAAARSASSTGGGYSFTGGGGAFGGAGASGSWAVAAGAIASGVSAPGSSSGSGSSSGGSSGGSSSGGGGGGGW